MLPGGLRAGTHLDMCKDSPARQRPYLPSMVLRKQLVMNEVRKAPFESSLCPFPAFSALVFSSVKWRQQKPHRKMIGG